MSGEGISPARRIFPGEHRFHPHYVVWELTLKCDLACRHCGSRAGRARASELSLDEAREVVRQLAELGTEEVAFIGGEAYLHPDWLEIVRAVRAAGIRATMTSGARALDRETCQAAAEAGMVAVSVSIDGLESTHDTLRAVPGSWAAAMQALDNLREAGIVPIANTQINRLNLPELEALAELLFAKGIRGWQTQMTGPMGRAADRPEWLLQPFEVLALFEVLARVGTRAVEEGVTLNSGNNLGYYGPYEHLIRREPWGGCAAGRFVMGIESNGDVKACPSLPSAPYVSGNVRETPIAELWARKDMAFARDRGTRELWGYCKRCYYAEECQGGCSWTSHTLLGRRGNMPWCHHRALELQREGKRERLEQVQRAAGEPFDFGRFELIEEPWPSAG